MGKKPRADATDRLLQSLFVLSRAVEEVLEFRAGGGRSHGDEISSNKLRALMFLHQQGNQTSTLVADFLKISPGAITQLADSLAKSGFLQRLRAGHDRRVVYLSLTARGRRFVRSIRGEQREILEQARKGKQASSIGRWAATLDEISRALVGADHALESVCLQCGAYADGSCILEGGAGPCRLQELSRVKRASRSTTRVTQPSGRARSSTPRISRGK